MKTYKINKNQINFINEWLLGFPRGSLSKYEDLTKESNIHILITEKIVNFVKDDTREYNDIIEEIQEFIFKYWKTKLESKYFKLNSMIVNDLILSTIYLIPRVSQFNYEEQAKVINNNEPWFFAVTKDLYHYSCNIELIKQNGLRPSNFLNNRNDQEEIIFMLKKAKLNSNIFMKIYNSAIINKYNSFAYTKIHKHAEIHFLNGADHRKVCLHDCIGVPKNNYLSIKVSDFNKAWHKSNISKEIIFGYVRYLDGFNIKIFDFISKILLKVFEITKSKALLSPLSDLVAIVASFVKRKSDRNYKFTDENEFRFLYKDLTDKDVPNHFIELDRRVHYCHTKIKNCILCDWKR